MALWLVSVYDRTVALSCFFNNSYHLSIPLKSGYHRPFKDPLGTAVVYPLRSLLVPARHNVGAMLLSMMPEAFLLISNNLG